MEIGAILKILQSLDQMPLVLFENEEQYKFNTTFKKLQNQNIKLLLISFQLYLKISIYFLFLEIMPNNFYKQILVIAIADD